MGRNVERKIYRKPRVVSEKVFEQAALACTYDTLNATYTNLKTTVSACGLNHS